MSVPLPRALFGAVATLSVGLLVSACGSSGAPAAAPAGAGTAVTVALSDAGCQPTPATVPGGPVAFTVTNSGSGAVTEERLLALIPHLPDGVSEIYGHPATEMTAQIRRTMPDYRHPEELAGLLSQRVRAALAAHGDGLTSFSELAA